MKKFDVLTIINVLTSKAYKIIAGKPFLLNIVGIRSVETSPNKFDDMLVCFFKEADNKWRVFYWNITTDPGLYWLKNPLNVNGTAILVEGQYLDAYQLGLHHGKYQALVQAKPVKAYRDNDRDAAFDKDPKKIDSGLFGINIHRASEVQSYAVDKWSAGCQVFQNGENFRDFIQICMKAEALNGNSFSYTLLNEKDFLSNGITT